MEKKIKPSDKPLIAKIVYGAVISILVITAIVVGIVSAASKDKNTDTPDTPDEGIQGDGGSTDTNPDGGNTDGEGDTTPKPLSFVSPTVGTVAKEHSTTIPVFSTTLGEWRVHTGIDISAEAGASVYASEGGVVSGIYSDPLLGYTVEITHRDNLKTRYSNLTRDDASTLKVGDTVCSGDKIGTVGDTSISELAEESHLHFEILLGDVKVNPLDYITRDSQESSLGIRK